jgi:hypothetical protein
MEPLKIVSQNIYKELSAASVNWLLANVGDKLRIETVVDIQIYCIGSNDNPFTLNCTDGYVGTAWVKGFDDCFKNFKIGDTVSYYDVPTATATDFTIVDKLSDFEIRLNTPFPGTADNYLKASAIFSVKTAITAVKYRYNFIENGSADTFLSMFDGSEQLLVIESKLASDASASAMKFIGPLTWQNGSATIDGVSVGLINGVWTSKYLIKHYTKVPPYLVYNQVDDQIAGIPYKDFKVLKCWKYISLVEAAEVYTNPNFLVSEVFSSVLGNSGWYNENYNTGKTNYSISNVAYNNGGVIDSLQYDDTETTITFNINNTVDTPFSNNNTKFVLGFFKIPADPAEYQNNNTLLDHNFLYDRALQTVGSAAVNGDNYGGTYEILKSISAAYVSTSVITITAKVKMSAAVLASFQASSLPQYFLFCQVQNHTKVTADPFNDLVSLVVDINEFTVISSDTTMIVADNVFIRHPENDRTSEGVILSDAYGYEVIESTGAIGGDLEVSFALFTIGTAAWNTDLDTTFQDLVDSINTNTIGCAVFGGKPAFDNSLGFTATWDLATYTLTIYPPASSENTYYSRFVSGVLFNQGFDEFIADPTGVPASIFDVFPEDEIVACSNFYIETLGRETDVIKLTSVSGQVVARHTGTGEEFELDGFHMSLGSIPLTGDSQQFDSQVARAFHIPVGTLRKYIEVKRRNDLDTTTKRYFSSNYPFLFRWEYWTQALGVHSDFFKPAQPNNGFNEWWYHYADGKFWILDYKLTINATKNGTPQQYVLYNKITPHDYNSNAEWTAKTITTFDPDTLTSLVTGGNTYISGYKDTLVVAEFTKATAPSGYTVVIGIEAFEQGGIYGKRRYSSKWVGDSDTWFKSMDGSGKVVLTETGTTITAKCLIDFTQLPQGISDFKITARIYDPNVGNALETDDGVPITDDDGVAITVD